MSYTIERLNNELIYGRDYLDELEGIKEGEKRYVDFLSEQQFRSLNMNRYYWGYLLPLYLDSFSTVRDAHQTFGETFLERKEKIDIKMLKNIRSITAYIAQFANVYRSQNPFKIVKDDENECFYFIYYLSTSKLSTKQMLNYFKDIENSEASKNIRVERYNKDKRYV